MLSLYRRHKPTCKLAKHGSVATNCTCVIWVYGTVEGRPLRRSMATKDWTRAHKDMVQLEAGVDIEPAVAVAKVPTIAESINAYLDDCEASHIAWTTIKSYRSSLEIFLQACPVSKLSELNAGVFSAYRASRQVTAATQRKELTHLKQWCKFCVDREWLKQNYVKSIKMPQSDSAVTMPYTREEIKRLIDGCAAMPDPINSRAVLLTMLYSGLRISDITILERTKLQADGRLQIRMEKTGHPVYVRLQPDCIAALNALPVTGTRFFWDEMIEPISAAQNIRNMLAELGEMAGVKEVRPHRFRDTFAVELLIGGADIRDVQKLLGHGSVQTTEKHYSPWITAMQAKLDAETAKLNFG